MVKTLVFDKKCLITRFFVQNTYLFVSEHSASFSLFKKKKTPIFFEICGQGVCPSPQFTDMSATNRFFLTPSQRYKSPTEYVFFGYLNQQLPVM